MAVQPEPSLVSIKLFWMLTPIFSRLHCPVNLNYCGLDPTHKTIKFALQPLNQLCLTAGHRTINQQKRQPCFQPLTKLDYQTLGLIKSWSHTRPFPFYYRHRG